MSESKHTPGPWESEIHQSGMYLVIDGPNGEYIAGTGVWAAEHRAEQNANARLIAAAPELLEALISLDLLCRDLLMKIDGGKMEMSGALPAEINAARAAIAKAKEHKNDTEA